MRFQTNGPTIAFDTMKQLLREYYNNGLVDSDKLLLKIVPNLPVFSYLKTQLIHENIFPYISLITIVLYHK